MENSRFTKPPSSAARRHFIKSSTLGFTAATFGFPLIGCGGGSDSASSASAPIVSKNLMMASDVKFGQIVRNGQSRNQLIYTNANGLSLTYGQSYSDLNGPQSAAFSSDGSFWVADAGNKRILHLSPTLVILGLITSIAGVALKYPSAVASLPDGRLAVSDSYLNQIAVTDSKGAGKWFGVDVLGTIKSGTKFSWASAPIDVLDTPKVIRIGANSEIVVLDTAAKRLVIFSDKGSALSAIPLSINPSGFAIAPDNTYYVCDVSNKKIISFPFSNPSSVSTVAVGSTISPYKLTWLEGRSSNISNLIIYSLS